MNFKGEMARGFWQALIELLERWLAGVSRLMGDSQKKFRLSKLRLLILIKEVLSMALGDGLKLWKRSWIVSLDLKSIIGSNALV
ncbi:hypothetical protein PanWU01x14_238430 [Parasponia andersonii]|uniref:Uncharacterized protein n=1 Tax=Parasponia andersonii TaxID=3476 RepID=A0A2P5BHP0_PARAD|nr:hypothetical protein PanWU01x14_238430 [Parasponia andersonii]